MTDLIYALIQLGHNLGAVAVAGIPVAALVGERLETPTSRRLLLGLAVAWGVQAASGAGFALASLGLKGALPEVQGIALAALSVKIAATVLGLGAAALTAWRARTWNNRAAAARRRFFRFELIVALVAFVAAAFLRWYL